MAHIKPWAEELPKLRITLLKRMGVFKKPKERFVLDLGSMVVAVSYNVKERSLDVVQKEDNLIGQHIPLEWVSLKYGLRAYFYSESTGEVALDVFFYNGYWDTLQGHGLKRARTHGSKNERWRAAVDSTADKLVGANGHGLPRGARRQQLAEDYFYQTGMHSTDFDALSAVHSARAHARKLRRRAHRFDANAGPLSTLAAAEAGRSAKISPTAAWVLGADMRDSTREWVPETGLPRFVGPIGFVEDHPILDGVGLASLEPAPIAKIPHRPLFRGALMMPRKIHAWAIDLRWPAVSLGQYGLIQIAVDKTSADGGLVQVRVHQPDRYVDDLIELQIAEHSGRKRWYFVCPVTSKRCDRLFFRDGRFASAWAQRLVHKSQRVPKNGAA